MFRSFTIENFRCFRNLTLPSLERINLIAGKNNSGKTALLEAIHLHSYPRDCILPFTINVQRGISAEKKFDEDSCSWLFHDKDGASGFELQSQSVSKEERTLQGWLMDTAAAEERFPKFAAMMRQVPRSPWAGGYGRPLILKATANGSETFAIANSHSTELSDGIGSIGSSADAWDGPSVFLSSSGRSPEEDAAAFSELELVNRQDEILPSLRILEPRLQRLAILLLANRPVIHGHIGLSRQVPVQFMGEGIRRLLSILLALNQAKGGNVLIDEVENGLHHSVMVPVWTAIVEAARRAEVQVFATTHSYECIEAAQQAFQTQELSDLRLFRLDRIDGGIRVADYNQEILNFAIEMSLEVR
jgi:hypothetical protein